MARASAHEVNVMLRAFADWVTLYGHIIRTQRSGDLLARLSLAVSWFWMLVFIAPYIPFVEHIPWLDRIASYATRRAFGISFRFMILVLLPLIMGILHGANDAYRRRNRYYPRTYAEVRGGVDQLLLETGTVMDAIGLVLISIGRGWLAMFRWLINHLFVYISSALDVLVEWSSGTALDSFLVTGRPQDLRKLASFVCQELEASGQRVTFCGVAADEHGARGAALKGLDRALGVHGFIRSSRLSLMVGEAGVAGVGDREALGAFYLRVRNRLILHLLRCSHPDALGPEEKLNGGEGLPPGTLEALAGDEDGTMDDLRVLTLKRALVEGGQFLPGN